MGIRELRNDVAAVVRRAAAGERVVVTVDGRPVAQLGPLEAAGEPTVDDLVAAGLLRPPSRARPADPPEPEDTPVDARTASAIEELRS